MIKTEVLGRWTKERSRVVWYKKLGWRVFLHIRQGEVVVNPYRDQASGVSIMDIISGVRERMDIPVLSALRIFWIRRYPFE